MARNYVTENRNRWWPRSEEERPRHLRRRRSPEFWDETRSRYRAMVNLGQIDIFSDDCINSDAVIFERLREFEDALKQTKPGSLPYQAKLAEFKTYADREVETAPVGIYEVNDHVWGILYTRNGQVKISRGGINNAAQRVLYKIALTKLVQSVERRGGKFFGEYDERMRAAIKKAKRSC